MEGQRGVGWGEVGWGGVGVCAAPLLVLTGPGEPDKVLLPKVIQGGEYGKGEMGRGGGVGMEGGCMLSSVAFSCRAWGARQGGIMSDDAGRAGGLGGGGCCSALLPSSAEPMKPYCYEV